MEELSGLGRSYSKRWMIPRLIVVDEYSRFLMIRVDCIWAARRNREMGNNCFNAFIYVIIDWFDSQVDFRGASDEVRGQGYFAIVLTCRGCSVIIQQDDKWPCRRSSPGNSKQARRDD